MYLYAHVDCYHYSPPSPATPTLSLPHSFLLFSFLCLQSPSTVTDDLPRIAQLQNEVENRDKALLHCKKENDALKVCTLYVFVYMP